jgi:surfactin synthase thioesterase subunit
MRSGPNNRWITGRHCVGLARIRLICVPHAGAAAGAFSGWRRHLPQGVELAPVELPARGTRAEETMPAGFDALADALFDGLRPELTMPYVLFGHSLGGALGYEVARRVEEHGLRAPLAVLISGSRAPQVPALRTLAGSDDQTLLTWLADNGGLPRELHDYPSFLQEILRALRMDLEYADSYFVADPPPLHCPVHIFGGADDAVTPPVELPRWERCAAREFGVTLLPGGHSFPHTDPGAMIAAIQNAIPRPVSLGDPCPLIAARPGVESQ